MIDASLGTVEIYDEHTVSTISPTKLRAAGYYRIYRAHVVNVRIEEVSAYSVGLYFTCVGQPEHAIYFVSPSDPTLQAAHDEAHRIATFLLGHRDEFVRLSRRHPTPYFTEWRGHGDPQ